MKALLISMVIYVLFTNNTYCGSNYYIIINDTTFCDFESLDSRINALGGRINHIFPPNEFICYLPEDVASAIYNYHDCKIEGLNTAELNLTGKCGYKSWRHLAASIPEMDGNINLPQDSLGHPFKCGHHDFKLPADIDVEEFNSKTPVTNRITNNFMIGRIAVGIVLMESTGHLMDWTHDEELEAIAEAVEGYEYLTQQAEMRNVSLSWVYEINYDVLTSEEPILTWYPYNTGLPDFNWQFGWIDDALEYLEAGEEWDGIFNFANRIRSKYKTNWAFTLFIIKNSSIYSSFPNGAAGYTQTYEQYPGVTIRPPFAVSTYLYNGYSADLSSRVVAHESAHVFGAMDEYLGTDQCGDFDDCDEVGGYLRYPNMNCYYCGIYDPCLMQAETWKMNICSYTEGHIGWVDSDNDGAPDPIDPNSNRWSTIVGPKPGDLVRIFTLDNDFVNSIACTSDNTAFGDWILWDGHNYENQNCAPSFYYVNINGGNLFTVCLHEANMSILPKITNVSDQNGLINWNLEESFAYISCELYDSFDSLIARPFWNKLHAAGSYQIDISDIYCSSYSIEFSGWRPDGALSNVVKLDISHGELITPYYITANNHFDHQSIKLTFNDSNLCEDGWIIERKAAASPSWQIIDTIPNNPNQLSRSGSE